MFPVVGMYYSAPKKDLSKHLKPIRNDEELANFIKTTFENGGKVDLFVEHHGYDVLADGINMSDEELDGKIEKIKLEDIFEYVGPEHVGEEDVVISHVKEGEVYPVHDPNVPWNQMKPVLGMKFEHPYQLKECMINNGVANGYQLWYRRNDYRSIAVLCGRDVKKGRCSGQKGKQKEDDKGKQKVNDGRLVVATVRRKGITKLDISVDPSVAGHSFTGLLQKMKLLKLLKQKKQLKKAGKRMHKGFLNKQTKERNLQAGGEYEDKDKDFEDIKRSPYNDKDTEDIRRYS
ncbi:hypothetical protein Tco_0039069 [Tanacetum coccineum]